MNAQVSYGSWMSNYLNSNQTLNIGGQQISVRQAVASGDTRLISAATAAGRIASSSRLVFRTSISATS